MTARQRQGSPFRRSCFNASIGMPAPSRPAFKAATLPSMNASISPRRRSISPPRSTVRGFFARAVMAYRPSFDCGPVFGL